MAWIAAAEARRIRDRFVRDWTAVPRSARGRFAWTLTAAWAVAGALMTAAALALRGERGQRLEAGERDLLTAFVDAVPLDYSLAVFLESPGNGVIVLPLTFAAAVAFARAGRPLESVSILAASLLPAVVTGLGWVLWERQRPDFLYPGVPSGSLSAFPSGHMSMAIPLYGLLAWLWLRRSRSVAERVVGASLAALVVATAATARLVLSAHWPSDILAGVLLGGTWLLVLVTALKRALAETTRQRRVGN